MRKILLVFVLFLIIYSCEESENTNNEVYKYEFESIAEFKAYLINLAKSPPTTSEDIYGDFLDSLESLNRIPFVVNDSVLFLYYGEATTISWAGDFNSWNPDVSGYQGSEIGNTGVWILEKSFPSDARLDYKIVVDDSWILDPRNYYTQMSGYGPNSELRMPEWEYPQETILHEGVNRGTLSDNIVLNSSNLSYQIQYKVYLPYNYENLTNLPVIYVTYGHEYSDDEKGAMVVVLDNLIYSSLIEPVVAVFIDPREPGNLGNNRRGDEYTGNINYTNFVADELVAEIDANYKTNSSAASRAILGTSLGGWNSAYFGYKRSDKFQLIGIHSPAFDNNIITNYQNTEKLPLKIYMSTGVINDTEDRARSMKTIFEQKGYNFQYKEVNEGHSWGNWRGLIDEPLIYFFSTKNK